MRSFKNYFFNIPTQIFFILLSIGLLALFLFKDRYSMPNLQKIYNDFYPDKRLDSRMLFNIDIAGCHIRGVYEGDSFRTVESTGPHTFHSDKPDPCLKYNYQVGEDPNEFVNELVGSDFTYRMKQKMKENKKLENKEI